MTQLIVLSIVCYNRLIISEQIIPMTQECNTHTLAVPAELAKQSESEPNKAEVVATLARWIQAHQELVSKEEPKQGTGESILPIQDPTLQRLLEEMGFSAIETWYINQSHINDKRDYASLGLFLAPTPSAKRQHQIAVVDWEIQGKFEDQENLEVHCRTRLEENNLELVSERAFDPQTRHYRILRIGKAFELEADGTPTERETDHSLITNHREIAGWFKEQTVFSELRVGGRATPNETRVRVITKLHTNDTGLMLEDDPEEYITKHEYNYTLSDTPTGMEASGFKHTVDHGSVHQENEVEIDFRGNPWGFNQVTDVQTYIESQALHEQPIVGVITEAELKVALRELTEQLHILGDVLDDVDKQVEDVRQEILDQARDWAAELDCWDHQARELIRAKVAKILRAHVTQCLRVWDEEKSQKQLKNQSKQLTDQALDLMEDLIRGTQDIQTAKNEFESNYYQSSETA